MVLLADVLNAPAAGTQEQLDALVSTLELETRCVLGAQTATVTVSGVDGAGLPLPRLPVTSVATVTRVSDGQIVDPAWYRLRQGHLELNTGRRPGRDSFPVAAGGRGGPYWGGPYEEYEITYTFGLDPVPAGMLWELGLGLSTPGAVAAAGTVTSEQLGAYRVTYADGSVSGSTGGLTTTLLGLARGCIY